MRPPADGHDWLAIEDEEDNTTWMFDLTFLRSDFTCIYGNGCPSIDAEPDPTETLGCCTHGAHFVDDEDRESVAGYVALLTDTQWQHRRAAIDKGGPIKKKKNGDWVTRKVDGACIFLNRENFPGGGGCALHRAALEADQRPLDWKPDVCWQVPIHLDIHEDAYGHETVFVKAWNRRDWGPGGDDFHWWCIEEESAYVGPNSLYLTARDELVEMVGQSIYDRLSSQIDLRKSETPVAIS